MKKVILITGASSGMGKESAKELINQGHNVYTVARRIEQMQDLNLSVKNLFYLSPSLVSLKNHHNRTTFQVKLVPISLLIRVSIDL